MSHPLKTKQLQCFIAVAEELNFRIAAERLYMTQPPLSRQIKKLEETLGVQLFERNRQGVHITDAGRRFLQDARALLKHADDTLKKVRDYEKEVPQELNIGITTVVDTEVFPNLMSLFQEKYPDIKLNVRPRRSLNLIKNLKRGELDVALIGLPSLTEDLIVERLFTDPLAVALPSNHHLARKKQISLAELKGETLFWFNRELNPAYYDYCQHTFKSLKFSTRFVPEPADHHVLLGLIATGNGIALIPSSLKAIKRKGVVYKLFTEGGLMSIGIGVAFRPNDNSRLVQAFVQSVREYYSHHKVLSPSSTR